MKRKILVRSTFILLSLFLICSVVITGYNHSIPDSISVFAVEDVSSKDIAPFVSISTVKNDVAEAKLFGVVKLKSIDVKLLCDKEVYVGGMPVGIKLYTDGILISGTSEVDTKSRNVNPGELAGLKAGDIIKKINGNEVGSISDVLNAAKDSGGKEIPIKYERNGKLYETKLIPVKSVSEGVYKLGLWVRDGTAGIGTVTYIDPENNAFGGLGHGVCDSDTARLLPMNRGVLCDVTINNVDKGKKGDPGELQGYFSGEDKGVLISNTDFGVFGAFNSIETKKLKKIKIGLKDELKPGPATILCTLSDNNICEYDIEIEKINNNSNPTKNFNIKVTDKELISKAGGIVQGMSGSPIIQNGKLVGAVTHVLVDDPTRGYGIYIENMLSNSN
ncbi:MAG: SpoIVB peptidase [Ruminococcaceae bacterium]|nr:SpoIVB peptidase [Oscillospiraceae bacterium]